MNTILSWVFWFVAGFAFVMVVTSVVVAFIYLIIKIIAMTTGKTLKISKYKLFAFADGILAVPTCILLLTNQNNDTFEGVLAKYLAMVIIPAMILCFVGAVIIDKVSKNNNLD